MTRDAKIQFHGRFWVEAVLGGLSALLFVITLAFPGWVELAFHLDPDAGTGSLEWAIAALTSVSALACFALARRTWFAARAPREALTAIEERAER